MEDRYSLLKLLLSSRLMLESRNRNTGSPIFDSWVSVVSNLLMKFSLCWLSVVLRGGRGAR